MSYPIHHCRADSPCPVLIGVCQGPEPSKWSRPKWLELPIVLEIDKTGGK